MVVRLPHVTVMRPVAALAVQGAVTLGTLALATASLAAPAGETAMLNQRARDAVEVLQGKRKATDVFNQHFLADVPPDRLAALTRQLMAQNGKVLKAEDIRVESKSAATFRIRFERAVAVGRITLEGTAPFKVSGFRIAAVMPIADSPEKIRADFAALPGHSGFVVAKLGDGAPSPMLASHAGEQFAIGSTFKLWVLDALADDITAGRHRWDEVVRLGPRSLPGGITQVPPVSA